MPYHFLADIIVLLHFAFIIVTLFGGILSIWWQKVIWLHIPAVLWAALIEFAGWICLLTFLEKLKERDYVYISQGSCWIPGA